MKESVREHDSLVPRLLPYVHVPAQLYNVKVGGGASEQG